MTTQPAVAIDANEACASVAHRTNEVIAIYPITPASPIGEFADEWSARGRTNVWGVVPDVVEMQSEGGAAGTVHGALQAGALTTTFTASQGLLLMLPNLYKIAGELTSLCMHVAARSVATHALSIFGDHSDVMACRGAGLALLCSNTPQEAHDFAAIGQRATLQGRVPVLHFFDGFRTSHEIAMVQMLDDDQLRAMVDDAMLAGHRERALTPDRPMLRGTAQNPDVFFQAREACNPAYDAFPAIVQSAMDHFAALSGRQYKLFEYVGHPEAERVIVMMGSGAETAHETIDHLVAKGERVGLVKVRLYRPFDVRAFLAALPVSVKSIAVLDRCKEPGAVAEPLCVDVMSALQDGLVTGELRSANLPRVIGGRFGLSSKEFTPACVKAVFDELASTVPKRRFTVGIHDDVTHLSLALDDDFDIEPNDVVRAVFWGLGSDGTVGANKNSIKIIAEGTGQHAQAYFVYDSKKSGARTISHLRFGPRPIRSSYLIRRASFVGCHQFDFLDRYDVLACAAPGATLLLNSPYAPEATFDYMPLDVQREIIEKKLRVYVIDAYSVATELGLGRRINTIMQACFFAISGVLPRDEAIAQIKAAIEKTYGAKGREIVRGNFAAVDSALDHLYEMPVPSGVTTTRSRPPAVPDEAPEFVRTVTALMMAGHGDRLPVSAFPPDGTWPTATSKWEKRNIAHEVPVWDPEICIQCNKCVLVCPHSTIRAAVYDPAHLANAPATFKSTDFKSKTFPDATYTLQVAVEDCTGCHLCVEVCPARDKTNPRRKAINMEPQRPLREPERENYNFFLDLPPVDRLRVKHDVKETALLEPLFEYSGACAGCGETPYLRLLSQLFGDRTLIANATGCSSIYGGNLPTTPWTVNRDGRGPAWSNSLFEDNAEFGLGFRLAVDAGVRLARQQLQALAAGVGDTLARDLLDSMQADEAGIRDQRARVVALREKLKSIDDPIARSLDALADYLVRKSVWIVGGDGWAYDIGYGGLDHVLATGRDVNLLVLDTEVYSNTGGQQSKATPLGAAAKYASAGKTTPKKDIGMMAMAYGNVYVAQIAWGAKDAQTVKAFLEAESYPGPSLIIANSPCIAHGYDLAFGARQQTLAMEAGVWPLWRFDPRRVPEGKSPLVLDSKHPTRNVLDYARNEARFRMVEQQDRHRFKDLMKRHQADITRRTAVYEQLAKLVLPLGAEFDVEAGLADDDSDTDTVDTKSP